MAMGREEEARGRKARQEWKSGRFPVPPVSAPTSPGCESELEFSHLFCLLRKKNIKLARCHWCALYPYAQSPFHHCQTNSKINLLYLFCNLFGTDCLTSKGERSGGEELHSRRDSRCVLLKSPLPQGCRCWGYVCAHLKYPGESELSPSWVGSFSYLCHP